MKRIYIPIITTFFLGTIVHGTPSRTELNYIPELTWDWEETDTTNISFPKGFLWGITTPKPDMLLSQSYTEGEEELTPLADTPAEDGFIQDIALLKELGVKSHRFTINWEYIEPQEGEFNNEAIDYYERMCDALISAGITPFITLFHKECPLWFERKGAFDYKENIPYFVRFCKIVFKRLGHKAPLWNTVNEPVVYATRRSMTGVVPVAPASLDKCGSIIKNLLASHVGVYTALKQISGGENAQIGFAKNIYQYDSFTHHNMLEKTTCSYAQDLFNDSVLRFFTTGTFSFYLPMLVNITYHDSKAPDTLDFIGLNYYSHYVLQAQWHLDPNKIIVPTLRYTETVTDAELASYPEGLYRSICQLGQLCVPVYVTENGIADAQDTKREQFMSRHLYALSKALGRGYDVRGYFYRSLKDLIELDDEESLQFGLYAYDLEKDTYVLRDSATSYMKIMADH